MSRRFLRGLRTAAEGMACLGLALILLPFLLWPRGGRPPGQRRDTLGRWARRVRYGLNDLREAWWIQSTFEPVRNFWHHLLLLEAGAAIASVRPPLAVPLPPSARILVVKLAHFGDALHIVPLLKALRAQRPGCSIDLVVGPWCEALARRVAPQENVLVYAPHYVLFNRGLRTGKRGLVREISFLWKLRRRRYDLMISTSTMNLPELLLAQAAQPALLIGAASAHPAYPVGVPARLEPYASTVYEADRVSGLLRLVGLEPGSGQLEYPLDTDAQAFGARVRADLLAAGWDRMAVLAPGAGWPDKAWPPERFAALADWLMAEQRVGVVLVGAPPEEPLGRAVAAAMRQPPMNLVGQTTLDRLAGIVQAADVFVGNDSGPMHLAAAYGIPALCLFGPTVAAKWAPPRRCRVLQHRHDCVDCCSWHPLARCQHDRACLRRISVEEATAALQDLLERPPGPRREP